MLIILLSFQVKRNNCSQPPTVYCLVSLERHSRHSKSESRKNLDCLNNVKVYVGNVNFSLGELSLPYSSCVGMLLIDNLNKYL